MKYIDVQFDNKEWQELFAVGLNVLNEIPGNSLFVESFRRYFSLPQNQLDIIESERQIYMITSELLNSDRLLDLQNKKQEVLWYDYLQLQIYMFLTGKSTYGENKTTSIAAVTLLIDLIVSDVCTKFGTTNQLIPVITSLLFFVISKVSIKSWCLYFYSRLEETPALMEIYKKGINDNE